jgi:hypothetical protein
MKRILGREWRERKQRRHAQDEVVEQTAAAPPAAVKPTAPKRRLWLFLLLCLLGSSVASFVIFKYIAPRIPRELVGTWQVVEGDLKGATLEFRWYGTATATEYKQGKKETVDFSVEVDDDIIYLTTKDAFGRQETLTQTILDLSDNELIIQDADRKTYRMVRVRP